MSDLQLQISNEQAAAIRADRVIGGIVPHAGYQYCGLEAVHFFDLIGKHQNKVDTFVILHPDHYGCGMRVFMDPNEAWRSPLGAVRVDIEMRDALDYPLCSGLNSREHAAEVLVPFLQNFIEYEFAILPIGMSQQQYSNSHSLANALHDVSRQLDRQIMVLASSDFSHYVEPEIGYQLDGLVIDRICHFDPQGLHSTVMDNKISVCGHGPIMTLLDYAIAVAAKPQVKILARGNSGKTSRSKRVVDYVSAVVYE
jgi:AmmeMemoRadiSam system protein B